MDRVYQVWNTSNRETKQITQFFVTDVTEEEAARDVNRTVAVFPVSGVADEDRQRTRAERFTMLLNGYVKYEVTDKGRAYDERVRARQAERREQERLEKAERDESLKLVAEKGARDALLKAMAPSTESASSTSEPEPEKKSWLARWTKSNKEGHQ